MASRRPVYRAILMEPESQGNIGFIARLIENFGIDEFFLVNPQCSIGEKARTHAVHAQDTLTAARDVDGLDHAMDGLDVVVGTTGVDVSDENLVRNGITPRELSERIPGDTHVGLLFGREGQGLSNDELDRCDFTVCIPTSEAYPVMNLSHAVAVLFYECYRPHSFREEGDGTSSSREQRRVLENLFKDVTETVAWSGDRKEKAVRAFRNVLGRSFVTDRETALLIGLFKELREPLSSSE